MSTVAPGRTFVSWNTHRRRVPSHGGGAGGTGSLTSGRCMQLTWTAAAGAFLLASYIKATTGMGFPLAGPVRRLWQKSSKAQSSPCSSQVSSRCR